MGSAGYFGKDDLVAASPGYNQFIMDTATATEKEAPIIPTMHNGEQEIENTSRPRGVRFVVLFISILAGDFFVGYVRFIKHTPHHVHLSIGLFTD